MSLPTERLGSTYRVQLNGIGLCATTQLVDYLHDLGIQTLYVSPILAAAKGSSHGYDVVDPSRIDPALGTRDDLDALLGRLDSHGMRLLIDIVPNHMSNSSENLWWTDVLRLGRHSEFARFFDIDWDAGGQKVVLPVLGAPFGEVLEAGDLRIQTCEDLPDAGHRRDRDRPDRDEPDTDEPDRDVKRSLCIRYGDLRFPLSPESCGHFAEPVGDWLERLNGSRDHPRSFDSLEALLDAQHYRLCFWELAREQVNYRRFFDIDGLVGVRVEDPEVYSRTHELVFELARDRRIAGIRVDHVDGLANPAEYLKRLKRDLRDAGRLGTHSRGRHRPVVLVEKILARDEELPAWDIDGTTGYEFADLAVGVLTDDTGARLIGELASSEPIEFRDLAIQGRRQVLEGSFEGKLEQLATLVVEVAASSRHGRDLSFADVRLAIRELTAHMTVYRTYIGGDGVPSATDQTRIDDSAEAASAGILHESGLRALEVLRRMLLSIPLGTTGEVHRGPESWARFRMQWQQLASAVAAKGVEDTSLYRFSGLLSAGDVGSDPDEPAVAIERFHRGMQARSFERPGSLNATSTHDSKRSEDVRSRLAVLSEIPDRWAGLINTWRERHLRLAGQLWGQGVSDLDLPLYQTIVGVWPLQEEDRAGLTGRVQECMQKAEREAKLRTSWGHPELIFEAALHSFVERVLDGANHPFHRDMERLVEEIGRAGAVNSLALVVLKATAPGVPDFYQGTEIWDPLLVDPDNRRPVDFDRLRHLLSQLPSADQPEEVSSLLTHWRDGGIKAFVTRSVLTVRRAEPDLFAEGEYLPLEVRGRWANHVVAFARRTKDRWAIAVVPRLVMAVVGPGCWPIGGAWDDTEVLLPANAPIVFTYALGQGSVRSAAGTLRIADLFSVLPVSVLLG